MRGADESDKPVHERRTTTAGTQPGTARSLRVCMVVHAYFPVGEPRAHRAARAAVEAGHEVNVLCLRRPRELRSETIDGVHVHRLEVEHVRGLGVIAVLREYAKFAMLATVTVARSHFRSRLDVVYVNAPPDFLIVSALIPRLSGAGVVLDIHDISSHMFDVRFAGSPLARPIRRVLRLIERGAALLAQEVITVHDPYRDELVANGVARHKISVVMNTPDESAVARARAGAARPKEGFVVAYHGTVTYWYGVDIFVGALGRLAKTIPDLRGLVLGEGDALPSVEKTARDCGMDATIRFSRAYLPYDDVLAEVATADCGVIPNRTSELNKFALSSKLFEYVALGVPVAVARLPTLAAHFSPDEVTYFDPDDVESLAQAIAWIYANPAEAREKVRRAKIRSEQYSWPTSRARLLTAIECAGS